MGNLDKDQPVIVMDVLDFSIDSTTTKMMTIDKVKGTWFTPMWNYLSSDTLPDDKLEARRIKKIASLYSSFNGQLYKKGYLRPWLKCVREDVAQRMLNEVHEGICGSHQGAKTLAKRVLRAGFCWPTMQLDAVDLVKKCEKCQFHSKLNNILRYNQISISGAWPNEANAEERNTNLELIAELRDKAKVRVIEYQRRVKRAFDRHIAPRHF